LLEKEKAIAELEALKTQVSPHFLFNSFNTLLQVIEEDQEKALEYTSKLSDFYRSLISYRNKNLVSLEEEWQLLENYFFLQKMRFEDALHLHISGRSENDVQYWIPPLILQLLAENAIKHNTVSLSHPLHIEVSLKDHQIIFRNNINVKKDKEKGEGIGIENIRNRYKSLISRPVVIQNTGTHFTVMIPVIHRDELQNLQFSSS
jgi:LytS/YehU family sensor histidine kinase